MKHAKNPTYGANCGRIAQHLLPFFQGHFWEVLKNEFFPIFVDSQLHKFRHEAANRWVMVVFEAQIFFSWGRGGQIGLKRSLKPNKTIRKQDTLLLADRTL